jgi:mRNA interferase RelE/StbE
LIWKTSLDPRAVKELKKLDKEIQRRIIDFLKEKLETHENPRRIGAPLAGKLSGLWKYRIGDYRLVCQINDGMVEILVIHLGHRKNVYI